MMPQKVMAAAVEEAKDLYELNQNNFYDYLKEAGNDLVVVDFFTDWCALLAIALNCIDTCALAH